MAKKLVDQDEAARILGVSPEEIGSLRDRKKLFPYRDGADWKFKQEDVERLRDELRQETRAPWKSAASEDSMHAEPRKPPANRGTARWVTSNWNSTTIWIRSCSAKSSWANRPRMAPAP